MIEKMKRLTNQFLDGFAWGLGMGLAVWLVLLFVVAVGYAFPPVR